MAESPPDRAPETRYDGTHFRLRADDERLAVERLKDKTGKVTASRAILRAVREWPNVAAELAAERRRSAALTDWRWNRSRVG